MNDAAVDVSFVPAGVRAAARAGDTVLDVARRVGVDLDSVCGGRGICGRCQIVIDDGEATATTSTESAFARRRGLADDRRLGCQVGLQSAATIVVPPESHVHRQVVRKAVDLRGLVRDPAVTLHYVELGEPALGAETSSLDRLLVALRDEWGLRDLDVSIEALADLAGVHGGVTVVIHDGRLVGQVRPGFVDRAYGVAFDLGSTTIAGYLCDLTSGEVVATAGTMNPQIRFGDDLMSRVAAVMMDPSVLGDLTGEARAALAGLGDDLCRSAGIETVDVHALTLVANPVMHHIVLGIDPTPLGTAPFSLATDAAVRGHARDIGLDLRARLYVGPCIAGHVGADAAAAIANESLHTSDAVTLLVDIGTNAEIVLGDRDSLLAASSPTGPAFEGAQITCGQRASPGAIERVRIDPVTLEPRYRVVGAEPWSDEPDFEAATAGLPIGGLCGSGIIEMVVELQRAGVIDANGAFVPGATARSDRVRSCDRSLEYVVLDGEHAIVFTQADVRAVQLAKAALRAGIDLLLEHRASTRIDVALLAGAFGAHVDPAYAIGLGLVPDIPVSSMRSVGNAAGAGAVRLLLSRSVRDELESTVGRIVKIETATEPAFQAHFVAAMAIPHASAHPVDPGAGRRRRRRERIA